MVELTRKENNITAKNRGIIELLNALSRYHSRRKVKNTRKKISKIGEGKLLKNRILQKMN